MANRKSLDELELLSPKLLGAILLYQLRSSDTYIQYIKDLINAGASLVVNISIGTPLHLAVDFNNLEIFKALIEAGAPLEAPGNAGWTALHRAAFYGQIEDVKLLTAAGASKDVLNKMKETPWDVAEGYTQKQVPELNPNYNG